MWVKLKNKAGEIVEIEAIKEGKGWWALCPFHVYTKPSLFIYPSGSFKCFGCGASGTVVEEEQEHKKLTIEEFSKAKKLPMDFLKQNYVREYENRLIFFYLNEEGDTAKAVARYRHSLEGANRFSWEKGAYPISYGLWRLKEYDKEKPLIIAEGESDTLTLWFCVLQAIGIPGVHAWKPEFTRFFKHFKRFFVLVEPDSREALYKAVRKNLNCMPLFFKHVGFKDASEAYIALGKDEFIKLINGMIEEAEESTPKILPISEVVEKEVQWAIPFWFAKGVMNLIVGEPGVGKTTLILNLVAQASTGCGKVPSSDGFIEVPLCRSLYISTEDDLSAKVKPLLKSLGVGENPNIFVTYANDLKEVKTLLKEADGFGMIIIDPLTNLIVNNINKIDVVFNMLKPLKAKARNSNVALVGNWHLNKNKNVLGSVAFKSLAKTITLIGKNEDLLITTQIKNAFMSPLPSLKLRIDRGIITWLGISDVDVNEAINEKEALIKEFLLELADEKPEWNFSEIAERAKNEGLNVDSVRTVGQRLVRKGFISKKRIYSQGKIATSVWVFLRNTEGGVSKAQMLDNSQFMLKKQGGDCFLRKGIIGDPYVESEIKKIGEVKTPPIEKFFSFLHFTAQRQREKFGIYGEEIFDLNWISEEAFGVN